MLILVGVELGMRNAASGAHDLYLAMPNYGGIAHAVAVLQIALQGNGNNFHVVVRVSTKAHSGSNNIVVENPQEAKMHLFRVVEMGKTKGVVGIQPAVVGMSTFVGSNKCCFHGNEFVAKGRGPIRGGNRRKTEKGRSDFSFSKPAMEIKFLFHSKDFLGIVGSFSGF